MEGGANTQGPLFASVAAYWVTLAGWPTALGAPRGPGDHWDTLRGKMIPTSTNCLEESRLRIKRRRCVTRPAKTRGRLTQMIRALIFDLGASSFLS